MIEALQAKNDLLNLWFELMEKQLITGIDLQEQIDACSIQLDKLDEIILRMKVQGVNYVN